MSVSSYSVWLVQQVAMFIPCLVFCDAPQQAASFAGLHKLTAGSSSLGWQVRGSCLLLHPPPAELQPQHDHK